MPSSAYYRIEAERCRKLAAAASNSDTSAHWQRLATEYEQLADGFDKEDRAPRIMTMPMQQQPVQQQQSKTEKNDD